MRVKEGQTKARRGHSFGGFQDAMQGKPVCIISIHYSYILALAKNLFDPSTP